MKPAGEIVTLDFAGLTFARNAHGFHAAGSECGDRPTIGPMRDAAKIVGEADGLRSFAWNEHPFQAEARHAWARVLLANANHFRATFARVGGDCEKQRARAGDDDAFSGDVEAGFYEGLQAACAHNVWKSPT